MDSFMKFQVDHIFPHSMENIADVSGAYDAFLSKDNPWVIAIKNSWRQISGQELHRTLQDRKKYWKSKSKDPIFQRCLDWMIAHDAEITAKNDEKHVVLGDIGPTKDQSIVQFHLEFISNTKQHYRAAGYNIDTMFLSKNGYVYLFLYTFDFDDPSVVTSVMYVDMVYNHPYPDIYDGKIRKFDFDLYGHIIWDIEHPNDPIKPSDIVPIGKLTFTHK